MKRVIPKLPQEKFLIESEKEGVVGKCYCSKETVELYEQLKKANLTLPSTKRGIALMLKKACEISGLPRLNPHISRKVFFSTGCNLNINRDVLKVLMFKSVSKDILTYLLNRDELRSAWQQIVSSMPLEKTNGRIIGMEELVELSMKALVKLIMPEVKRLMLTQIQTPSTRIGLIEINIPKTPREIIEAYLRLTKEG